jgi:hypothetical protein
MEYIVVEKHWILALDIALKYTPSRWWDSYKEALSSWNEVKISI